MLLVSRGPQSAAAVHAQHVAKGKLPIHVPRMVLSNSVVERKIKRMNSNAFPSATSTNASRVPSSAPVNGSGVLRRVGLSRSRNLKPLHSVTAKRLSSD